MIHPSYKELIAEINKDAENEEPVVSSRYSIVLATSKRARQLIAGADPKVDGDIDRKALSIAIDEIYEGKVNIVTDLEEDGAEYEAMEEIIPVATASDAETEVDTADSETTES